MYSICKSVCVVYPQHVQHLNSSNIVPNKETENTFYSVTLQQLTLETKWQVSKET